MNFVDKRGSGIRDWLIADKGFRLNTSSQVGSILEQGETEK